MCDSEGFIAFWEEYIEAGNYIEKVFPFLGVRFISIVDRYDSKDSGSDRELLLLSLKNLMHEMYAKDISKKIGSTFQMKWEKEILPCDEGALWIPDG